MDTIESLKQQLAVMEEAVERVYAALRSASEQQATILNKLNARSQSDVDAVKAHLGMLGSLHAQEAMLMALIASHPDKTRLHVAFAQFWDVYRGGIGSDDVNDAVRLSAQQMLARFGTALGKPVA